MSQPKNKETWPRRHRTEVREEVPWLPRQLPSKNEAQGHAGGSPAGTSVCGGDCSLQRWQHGLPREPRPPALLSAALRWARYCDICCPCPSPDRPAFRPTPPSASISFAALFSNHCEAPQWVQRASEPELWAGWHPHWTRTPLVLRASSCLLFVLK